MNNFTIGEAWSQGVAFLSAHFRMILIFVAAGVLVPLILQFAVLGGSMESLFNPQTMMANPDNPFAAFAGLGAAFFLIAIVGSIIQSASYFASWRHGLSDGREDPAGSVTFGLGAGVTWLIAQIVLVILIVLIIGVPLGLLFGVSMAGGGTPGGGTVAMMVLLVPVLLVLLLWLTARLVCVGPVMADARSINPLYGLSQSWRLTRNAQWSIVGYLLILIIAGLVLLMVIGMIAGIVTAGAMAAGGEGGAGLMIVSIITGVLLGIPMALLYVAIPAGIYRALVPNDAGDVFA